MVKADLVAKVAEIGITKKQAAQVVDCVLDSVKAALKKGDKVKLTIMFRGRELVHPHLGERLLRRMADDLADIGEVESEPNLDGRNMVMMLAPRRS